MESSLPPDQLLRPLVVFDQLLGDPLSNFRTRPPELTALALLRCRPDHVAVLVHQADRGDGLMFSLLAVAGLVFTDSNSSMGIAAVGRARVAARADISACVDALTRRMDIGEDQVFGAASQDGVCPLLVFRDHEQLGALQAAEKQVPHLRRGFTASEPVYADAAD